MNLVENIYETLTDDYDGRLCEDIDENSCRESPRSFVLILASSFLTKLGDALASPKTTLAWLCTALGAPAFVLGMLVPVRESGSMIPQLFIGGHIRRLPLRKWVWVAGSIGQFICISALGLVAFSLEGAAAGWAILGLVTVFSLCRGLSSIASKDVMGKTIPAGKRGQLGGWSASAAGLVSIAAGAALMLPVSDSMDTDTLGMILVGAGMLWLVAALVYSQVPEFRGETGGGRSAAEALGKLRILKTDKPFRRFVITRALLMCSALSAPFYVALAQQSLGSTGLVLGAFILASGLADFVSAPFWGRFADRSSRNVMIAAAAVTAAIGIVTSATFLLTAEPAGVAWLAPLGFFILMVAHSGVRVGRKTFVVNLGSGNDRTDYVAISNTVIGVLLLVAGSVGALSSLVGAEGVIGLLALMGLAGALLGTHLPEVDRKDPEKTK